MKFRDRLKARAALLKHQKGQINDARIMYEELYRDGIILSNYILPYSVLLLRSGEEGAFQKVRELLVKAQKAPDLTEEGRQQLLMNYSIAVWKLGELDRAIATLEASHQKQPHSLTYQSLGFLYIETGDAKKALDFNMEALEYDEEDPITLDNLGQVYYRLLDDKETALTYFKKANELKPSQMDTLYFLSLYDLEAGRFREAKTKIETLLEGNFSPLNYVNPHKAHDALERAKQGAMTTKEDVNLA